MEGWIYIIDIVREEQFGLNDIFFVIQISLSASSIPPRKFSCGGTKSFTRWRPKNSASARSLQVCRFKGACGWLAGICSQRGTFGCTIETVSGFVGGTGPRGRERNRYISRFNYYHRSYRQVAAVYGISSYLALPFFKQKFIAFRTGRIRQFVFFLAQCTLPLKSKPLRRHDGMFYWWYCKSSPW